MAPAAQSKRWCLLSHVSSITGFGLTPLLTLVSLLALRGSPGWELRYFDLRSHPADPCSLTHRQSKQRQRFAMHSTPPTFYPVGSGDPLASPLFYLKWQMPSTRATCHQEKQLVSKIPWPSGEPTPPSALEEGVGPT